ncbi:MULTISPECIES: alpha/beta fold hydrolase [Frankia]|uniref:alpha/beta fold hydrolase n=1 Tax=Frankia TaxID=1854 RepID=UPI000309D85B|nr:MULTISPECIES: alpha/beta fold hydrolase [Frankia]
MAEVGIVLVHGGQHAGDCWEPTVAEIGLQAPGTPVLAVDLPGRRSVPADLATVTVDDWVTSTIAQIDAAGIGEFVIVGHSMAGLTVPGVVARLGPTRVRRMILLGAAVPPQGRSIVDTVPGILGWVARRKAATGRPAAPMPRLLARYSFCNGMTREQRAFSLSRLYGESTAVTTEPTDRTGLDRSVPRTWLLTLRDRAQTPATQRRSIEALGGVDEIVDLDTGHNAMISHPAELARLLLDRAGHPLAHPTA